MGQSGSGTPEGLRAGPWREEACPGTLQGGLLRKQRAERLLSEGGGNLSIDDWNTSRVVFKRSSVLKVGVNPLFRFDLNAEI